MPANTAQKPTLVSRINTALTCYIFDGVLIVALGLLVVMAPQASLAFLCLVLGIDLVVMGVMKLVFYAANPYGIRSSANIFVGLAQVALGIWIVCKPDSFVNVFQILTGIVLIYVALLLFCRAFALRGFRGNFFWISLGSGIVSAVLGVVVLLNPMASASAMMVLSGIALMVAGVAIIAVLVSMKREVKTVAANVSQRLEDAGVPVDEIRELRDNIRAEVAGQASQVAQAVEKASRQ